MLGQSARFYQQQPSAVLMSRVTYDVDQITAAVSDRFGDLFQDSFTLVALLVYVFSLNFRMALGALIVAPLLLWPVVHFSRKLRRRSHATQERLGELNSVLDEMLKGFRVVQAFGMEAFEARRFRAATSRHFRAMLRAWRVQALNAPVMEGLGSAGAGFGGDPRPHGLRGAPHPRRRADFGAVQFVPLCPLRHVEPRQAPQQAQPVCAEAFQKLALTIQELSSASTSSTCLRRWPLPLASGCLPCWTPQWR